MISIQSLANALELRVSGKVDRHDMIAARKAIGDRVEAEGEVSLLVWLEDFGGYETPAAFLDDLRLALGHRHGVAKLAVVGDARWLDPLLRLGSKLAPHTEVRRFEAGERDRARRWIAAPASFRGAAPESR